jgi:hypothetical protein
METTHTGAGCAGGWIRISLSVLAIAQLVY